MFQLGAWKSIKEMEEELSLDELYALMEAQHRAEHKRNKFAAALKGIDLDESNDKEAFEAQERKAKAALAGMSEEQFVFSQIGIEMEIDDD